MARAPDALECHQGARSSGISRAFVKESDEDKPLVARINRDLRYCVQRCASPRLVRVAVTPVGVERFGIAVSMHFIDGSEGTFRIVGEDEADPANGLVNWAAPLGKALTGKGVGDVLKV